MGQGVAQEEVEQIEFQEFGQDEVQEVGPNKVHEVGQNEVQGSRRTHMGIVI